MPLSVIESRERYREARPIFSISANSDKLQGSVSVFSESIGKPERYTANLASAEPAVNAVILRFKKQILSVK